MATTEPDVLRVVTDCSASTNAVQVEKRQPSIDAFRNKRPARFGSFS